MHEEGFLIENEDEQNIKGKIVYPALKGKYPAVILVNGLLDTMSSDVKNEMTEEFTDRGFAVVKFDFTNGFGASQGNPHDATINHRVNDLDEVYEFVKRRKNIMTNKVSLFGHCFGSMTNLIFCSNNDRVPASVVSSTPSSFKDTRITRKKNEELMKLKLKRYTHVKYHGEPVRLNYDFFEQGMSIDMPRIIRNHSTSLLVIHGKKDESVPLENAEYLKERAPGLKEMYVIDEMGHDISDFIEEIVEKTTNFLKEELELED